jgi:hypothetical protein
VEAPAALKALVLHRALVRQVVHVLAYFARATVDVHALRVLGAVAHQMARSKGPATPSLFSST